MATAQGKKKLQCTQSKKIDSYFKPVPKSDMSTTSKPSNKRQLENDENTTYNDENRKKVSTPSKAQPKRQFGDIKGGLSAKTNQTVIRQPLTDKNPKNSTISSISNLKTKHPKLKKPPPNFAVLCDEDIEKGVEKALTPPTRDSQEGFFDSQATDNQSQGLDSQTHTDSQNTPSQLQLNTQCIPETDDLNTQWTASSPINIYKDTDAESQLFGDDDEPLSVMIPHIRQSSTNNKPGKENYAGKENQIEPTEEEEQSLAPVDSLLPLDVDSPGLEESSVNNDEVASEKEEDDFFDQDDEDDDDEGDSDLFAKTVDTTIKFKDVPLKRSITLLDDDDGNGFFSDNNEQEDSTTFFDPESDDEGAFVNPDLEFSVNEFESAPGETLKEPSPSYTLSLEQPESISQVQMPLPNPRGKDLLEKLGYDKKCSKDSSRTNNAEENNLSTP